VSAMHPRRAEPLPLTIAVRAGAVVVHQGEPSFVVWRLESGAVRETTVVRDGRELALGILGRGDVVGEPPGTASATTVRALRLSRLRAVAASDAADLFAARARRAASLAAELAYSDVPTRLEARLGDLAARFGRPALGGSIIPFAISQDELAQLIGATRESVSRALGTLVAHERVRVAARGRYVVSIASETAPDGVRGVQPPALS
jgi:CRP/FNR family transcriptional regulator, cyclic AMP receptor protein